MRPTSLVLTVTALLLSPIMFGGVSAQAGSAGGPAPAAKRAASLPQDAAMKRGRQLVTWFYAQDLVPVWAAFQPSARANYGDLKNFQAYRASGVVTYGRERQLISEEVRVVDGLSYYLRTATFEKGPDVQWTLVFGLDALGRVVSFGILGAGQPLPERMS